MARLTQQKINLMEITNAIFRNGFWNILVMTPERIGYRLFFEGLDTDTDDDIKTKASELLSEMEEKENAVIPKRENQPINRETIKGRKLN